MTKTDIMNKATRAFNRVKFKVHKHSPEILIGAGVVGGVVSAVMACKATTKINFILEETADKIDKIDDGYEKGEVKGMVDGEVVLVPYTEEDHKKDLAIIYAQSGLKFAKLYAPSVLLGGVSIGSILAGANILRKRNIAIAAAYTAMDTGFKEYRNRVIERFGKELDRELKYNIQSMKIEETVTDENGKEKKVKKTVEAVDTESGNPTKYSPYARIYDDGNIGWTKDAEQNLYFLIQQQNYANDMLKARGHVFLNEIYDMLGFQRTPIGSVMGWVYDEEHPVGDNYIDFGIFDIYDKKKRDFVNGYERVIILDFNVDGDIHNLI